MTFPFDFRTRPPPPAVRRLVSATWAARGTVPYARERIAPTGSTVAVFVLGDPIRQIPDDGAGEPVLSDRGFLVGPHDRPTINEPLGETHAIGIVCTPVGCEAVFGVPPASLRGRVVPLEAHWPPATALRAALVAADGPEAQLDCVGAALPRSWAVKGLARAERAVSLLEADPTRPIGDIARALGISHAHLVRELTRVVGLTPRALSRLLRMRRLLAGLDIADGPAWSDLAHTLGWFDQAHLIRDFKRHTGVTPSEYLAAQRKHFDPSEHSSAPGFVPLP